MNRKQKRNFIKLAKGKGVDPKIAELYMRLKDQGVMFDNISDGDRVKLNLKVIQSHPDYKRLSEKYKNFVLENADTIFTVRLDPRGGDLNNVVSLKEDSAGWLFWTGDLIKVNE